MVMGNNSGVRGKDEEDDDSKCVVDIMKMTGITGITTKMTDLTCLMALMPSQ